MRIPRELPQFNTETALIMVASKQEAHFFKANQGTIEEAGKVKIEKPTYSDREGFFQRSGKGEVLGTGSVEEIRDDEIEQELLKELQELLDKTKNDSSIDKIYLFAPSYFITKFKKNLPQKLKDKIFMEFQKNVKNFHPTKILKVIDERFEEKIKELKNKPKNKEEEEILKKNEPNRKYI